MYKIGINIVGIKYQQTALFSKSILTLKTRRKRYVPFTGCHGQLSHDEPKSTKIVDIKLATVDKGC